MDYFDYLGRAAYIDYQPGQGWSRPLNHQNSQISLAQGIYYFYYVGHVIAHMQVVSRTFYDLGGWLGPSWQVSAKKIFRPTQPPFPRAPKHAKIEHFWTGHLMTLLHLIKLCVCRVVKPSPQKRSWVFLFR